MNVDIQIRPPDASFEFPSYYVVTSTKGKVDFTATAESEPELQRLGFEIGPPNDGYQGLYKTGNRVALLFTNKRELSDYLNAVGCKSAGFPREFLAWWIL